MSHKVFNTLLDIQKTVIKNTPKVAKAFAKVGVPADSALVSTTAQYYTTLKKLAKE